MELVGVLIAGRLKNGDRDRLQSRIQVALSERLSGRGKRVGSVAVNSVRRQTCDRSRIIDSIHDVPGALAIRVVVGNDRQRLIPAPAAAPRRVPASPAPSEVAAPRSAELAPAAVLLPERPLEALLREF